MDMHQYQTPDELFFQKQKLATLNKEDLSKKGSIDSPIRELVELINKHPYCYTTSTCSGRVTLIRKDSSFAGYKKNSQILVNEHEFILHEDILKHCIESKDIDDSKVCLWLKYEPFILHMQVFNLNIARGLLRIALDAGCRNSGLTFSANNKFMIALRSTSGLESPIMVTDTFNTDPLQVKFLCDECNNRQAKNKERLSKLYSMYKSFLE